MQKVSFVIPCYNMQKYIALCLDSVFKQTYPVDEILVINDGSVDNTVKIAQQFPVNVISHKENRGLAAARNSAVKQAKNEYIAFLDADCIARKDWLEQLMESFTDGRVVGAGGMLIERYKSTLADSWRAVHMSQCWGDGLLKEPPFLYGSNSLFKKTALMSAGLYNEKLRDNYEDVDLSNRLCDKGFKLTYNPNAIAEHLRKDTITSVLTTYWRWCRRAHLNLQNTNSAPRRIVARLLLIIELFHKFFQQDLNQRRYKLLPINFLLLLYFPMLDLRSYFRQMWSRIPDA